MLHQRHSQNIDKKQTQEYYLYFLKQRDIQQFIIVDQVHQKNDCKTDAVVFLGWQIGQFKKEVEKEIV